MQISFAMSMVRRWSVSSLATSLSPSSPTRTFLYGLKSLPSENGEQSLTPERLYDIAKVLETSPSYLAGWEDGAITLPVEMKFAENAAEEFKPSIVFADGDESAQRIYKALHILGELPIEKLKVLNSLTTAEWSDLTFYLDLMVFKKSNT